jgi:hypothetical protein
MRSPRSNQPALRERTVDVSLTRGLDLALKAEIGRASEVARCAGRASARRERAAGLGIAFERTSDAFCAIASSTNEQGLYTHTQRDLPSEKN